MPLPLWGTRREDTRVEFQAKPNRKE